MTAIGGYSAVVNNVYGGITHHLSPAYHTKTAEALADMETWTDNNQHAFAKLSQANATLSRSNATISREISETEKIMVTLAQQVFTMAANNNNNNNTSRVIGSKKNTYVRRLPLPPSYCWSHIWCKNSSKECTRKRPGHIDTSTKDNPQGRNTQGLWNKRAGNNTVSNRTK